MSEDLANLEFLVDELFFEPATPRGQTCAKQIYMHAYRGADLAPYAARLRAGTFTDYVVGRNIGWALAVWAYNNDDAELVRELLAGPHALATLQLDHRKRVGPGVIGELVRYAESVAGEQRMHAFRALAKLGRFEADLAPAVSVLLSELGTPAKGRGFKRVDLDASAREALTAAANTAGVKDTILAELARIAGGKGKPAESARTLRERLIAP